MKKLKVGVIGVGRLGYEHACNIANRVPGMELVAICDGNAPRAKEVADELNVEKIYSDPATMCADPEVEAVAIFTNTASHVDMIRIAMEAGKHVFCEKPLAENVEKCLAAEEIIKAHPNQVFMLGFMRRFDKSYRIAKQKIDNGDIGKVVLVRCYSEDPRSTFDSYLPFAPTSGGQFIDMSIHDIDLIRWLTGSEPKKIWAIGGCFEFPQFKDWDDGDNVSAHGSAVETEIVGTHGTLRIGTTPSSSLVEVLSTNGVCHECYQDFISRWHDAYITEMEVFCDYVAKGQAAEPNVYDGTKATRVAYACKESFLKNEMLTLD